MSTKKDGETKTVLQNLLILLIIFYITMYCICYISAAGLGWDSIAQTINMGMLPFWHWECGVGEGNTALAMWIGQVIAQLALLACNFFIVRSTLHVWDYAITVSFLHFVITCIVTQACPATWQWWVTLVVATLLDMIASELLCYFLIDLKEIEKN